MASISHFAVGAANLLATESTSTVLLMFLYPDKCNTLLAMRLQLRHETWPAMRVITLGKRKVPVLPVAKKPAAPRPSSTAPAAKCGLIREDEAD